MQDISGQPLECYFTWPLAAPGGTSTSVTLSLWSLKLQYPCWGETCCPNLKSEFYFPSGNTSISPFIEEQVDPTV
jgi:hypothetical protein